MTLVFRGKRVRFTWNWQRALSAQQNVVLVAASLLTPCALVAFTLTCWSVAADLRWTTGFFVSRGVFSHWQSWLIASSILLVASRLVAQFIDER